MGIIIRQGVVSSILLYAGMVLGFFIGVVLFPITLGTEVYGFTQWLVYTSYMLSVFSLLGMQSTTVKFFPYFRDKEKGHNGYLSFLLLTAVAGLLLVIGLIYLGKPLLLDLFQDERSEAFAEQYFFLIPVSLTIINFTEILRAYSTALFRPRVPIFFIQVFNRLLTLGLIGLFYIEWIDTDRFIKWYTFKNAISVLGLILFLSLIGEWHLRSGLPVFRRPLFRQMAGFGLYAIFAQIGNQIITRIDILMVGPLLDFGQGGIYTVFVLIATAITMPHDGIAAITSPLIAQAFKDKNLEEVEHLYRRTALNNLLLAVLLFVGIWANLPNAIILLGENYQAGYYVAVFLGLAQVIHVLSGYNGHVIIHSQYYRVDLLIKLFTALITITSNYIFIRAYGMIGAAVATAATLVLVNSISQVFIYRKFGFHPFSRNTLKVITIGIAGLAVGLLFPRIEAHFLLDLLLRSAAISLVYLSLALAWKAAPDVNNFLADQVEKRTGWDASRLRP